MYVGQVMTRKVVTAAPGDHLEKTFRTMVAKRIAHLPVLDKGASDKGTLVGIVSDRDLRKALANKSGARPAKDPMRMTVSDVMTREVITADPKTHVMDAVSLMLRMGIGALPVLETDRLKGIVTKDDLLVVFMEMLRMIQASSTIEVELLDEVDDVAAVFTVLRKHKCSVLSYSATPAGNNRRQVCHFRLALCPVKPIVRDLKKNGVKVLDAYGED